MALCSIFTNTLHPLPCPPPPPPPAAAPPPYTIRLQSVRSSSSSSSSSLNPTLLPASDPLQTESRGSSTLTEQLRPLASQYLHNTTQIPVASRKPPPSIGRRPRNHKPRFSEIDRWVPRREGLCKAMELLQQVDESEDAVFTAFSDWEGSFSCRDAVAILNEEPSPPKALAFFQWLKTNDAFSPNIYVYNVILKVLRREGQWNAAMDLMKEMQQNGAKPDNVTYSTIISFAIWCNLTEEAIYWYERMQEVGCTPDPVTYSTVINAYGQVGRMKEAFDIVSKLHRQGLGFDNAVCSTIVKLHGMQGDIGAVLKVYEEMKLRNVTPNVVTFNCIIAALLKAGRIEQIFGISEEMRSLGVKPSEVTLSLLVRAYGKVGMAQSAVKLFNTMKNEGMTIDLVAYNSLLSLCAETGFVEEGKNILKELLQSEKHRPDIWTWNAVVEMYAKAGKMEEARRAFRSILDSGFVANVATYTSLLQGYINIKDFKSVAALFSEIVTEGLPLDELLVGTLLTALSSCEEEEDDELILCCIEKACPRLRRLVDILGKEHVLSDDWKEEFRLLLNETPSTSRTVFCNLLINLCWAKNLGQQSHQIMGWGISFGLYPDLQRKSFAEWCLNLRTLSIDAARTALQGWFSSLFCTLQQGDELPPVLVIEVGTGIRHTQETPMNTFIMLQLKEIQAPFEGSNVRVGRYTATGEGVKMWMQSENAVPMIRSSQNVFS